MTLLEGLRRYPKACLWSLIFSSALIMEGFDKAFITAFFAFPPFQEAYGELQSTGDYQVPASLQAGIQNGVSAGQIIGLLLNGLLADWFGYRWVMEGCLFLMVCFVFLQVFATSIWMYLGAGVLLGVPWGVFQTLTTTYAAEVCPNVLRPYLTMLVSMCWSIGYLLGTGVLRAFLNMDGHWAYRIPFMLQWVLPVPLAVGIFLAPESPWWLARKGRDADTEKALRALQSGGATEEDIQATLHMIQYTVRIENEAKTSSSYLDLFRGTNLRRTEITVVTYLTQELCAPLVSYVVYFLQQAGMDTSSSFGFGMGQYALAIVGVLVAWYLAPRIGRRRLVMSGITFMASTTFVIGFMGVPADSYDNANIAYGIGAILLVEYFFFFMTLGPFIYTIVTEIPSSFLRTKSVVIARAVYNVGVLVYGQLVPRMIQRASWNWGPKSGFFCGGIMCLALLWAWFRLPETSNRTFAEVDILFKNRVKARQFKTTKVDLATQTVYKDE
ncbi:MFS transporter, SP family,ral alpha glucoside:H+ symporter [Geosmithia morbida]|uniref:MFS transporter, SP family,ral alpha glucoside:H+ symporter n=1 Tax=Geosmithia morbida TaxID=1094350 RepID=A0A9P4Z385_9HYPO|nr:MFS transporter, SP family,ral alpha glucoside:H+ symporter [Geosmithia morbida]KAF4126701.1 MFS transporter, SP family,ral alpha glucoside:H+ symporter [Geosmithia morbida]